MTGREIDQQKAWMERSDKVCNCKSAGGCSKLGEESKAKPVLYLT